MSRSLILELSDDTWSALRYRAQALGISPAEIAAASLEKQFNDSRLPDVVAKQALRERLSRHFGEVDLGFPTGAENERIDAELAAEYASTHDPVSRS